ncbi:MULTISPECIES: DUF6352 family protein [Ramlibacter]|uniref:Uncharacterized protein n=1 Tax=Ramlibacter pinisoli TaxID=2682844 RepID=A0A6N8IVM9_9BURK|nr:MULTISPECIES: DUF6352 family protein [Ramlibacter]MBA2965649.1 hypothetical protein [Ramlibacter sp. CGMCC 1.13660]MVQ30615.1 hypothetical protein [Ramlibacter pinisoli]
MADYWPGCGWQFLRSDADGQLVVTDDFLRHLLQRPELAPLPESCAAERALHQELLAQPRQAVGTARLAALADPDAADNYAVWLRFRERLLARPTLEGSYLQLFQRDVDVPPLLVHQLTQVLLRQVLGEDATPFQARAAELLFRPQRIAVQGDGQVMAADEETVESQALAATPGSLVDLLRQAGATPREAELDVLGEANAGQYWERSEAHDLVVQLNHGQPALAALCEVIERWIGHFLGVRVRVEVAREIDEDQWVWHVGLDAQATAVLNALYRGEDVDEAQGRRMLCLFRLEFADPHVLRPEVAGHPVWLAMAMDEGQRLRLKPQNLLLNLPLARQS